MNRPPVPNTLHVRPAAGLPHEVLDPVTYQPLPAEGRHVPNVSFWRRQIKQGRVELVTAKAAAKPTQEIKKGAKA